MELVGYKIVFDVIKNLKERPLFTGNSETEAKNWAYQNYLETFYIQPRYIQDLYSTINRTA